MSVQIKTKQSFKFSEILLKWNRESNKREMPWKGEKDPYKIWLSEVLLQQTRVDQGLKYYEKFIESFPNIHKLAIAPEQKVYKLWEGLGYYTRCRNLMETAKHISKNLKGKFPDSYEEIKKLKGVGPYTAAAIASFAFNKPYAVIDGNVFRVLARIFNIKKPIDSTEGKKFFNQQANELINTKKPGLYNQAIMDFGATICKPVPVCNLCPFNTCCKAFLNDKTSSLPVKSKKTVIQKRRLNYLVLEYKGKLAIRQRVEKDIWHKLYEFLSIEYNPSLHKQRILKEIKNKGWLKKNGFEIKSVSPIFRQQLSHQIIEGNFIKLKLEQKPNLPKDIFWISESELRNYAFPKFINQYLQSKV
ncbi:MAG TPA: A/G-specific adenine glycosylase [Chitinophagaceae bacterium]|jgi:A/G-specific adenine glycosylase|nr:A/G-specific adenine glycosylase [Chitinophagaceae bacterium]